MTFKKFVAYFGASFLPLYFLWHRFAPSWFSNVLVIETLLLFAWIISTAVYEIFNTRRISPYKKLVLITGCDSGFGHELAKRLDSYGKFENLRNILSFI